MRDADLNLVMLIHWVFSVRDVHYPGGNQHSLDAICGRPYDKCTKEDLLRYLGVDNPAVPFPIYFELTNNTAQTNYYNQSTFMCNEPVETSYDHQPMCTHYVSSDDKRRNDPS